MPLKHITTKSDFETYCARVAHFLARNNVKPGCHSPKYDDSENPLPSFFSWSACHCCERPLGGSRENYTFATNNGQMFDADICEDCIYFLEYGQLDDMAMMNLK